MTDEELTIETARQRIDRLRAEVAALREAMRAHDTVWRAKCWLTRDLSITPDEAHTLIWTESNDTNVKVQDIAQRIIRAHETGL